MVRVMVTGLWIKSSVGDSKSKHTEVYIQVFVCVPMHNSDPLAGEPVSKPFALQKLSKGMVTQSP